ncbi:MAG: ferrous iron transport protein A [Halobacteriovoraceae bacterium]|jgi:Fe2+ transport system protein FeoA|nr:ferrous iron transport protein A [Halobacteriovoraceae bacterium]MBT5095914.1 ferrous iron transport protein A [Halobacteriovoraceae bacterium]
MMPNLLDVKIGQKVRITKIADKNQTTLKLFSLGILVGDEIEITSKALFGCPLAIKHGEGNFFALRKDHAALIEVETIA